MGHLADIMLGKVITQKYYNPRSPVVNVSIHGQFLRNSLIDLGAAINVMTKNTIKNLKIEELRLHQQFYSL